MKRVMISILLLAATAGTADPRVEPPSCELVLGKCTAYVRALENEKVAMKGLVDAQSKELANKPATEIPWWTYILTGIAAGIIMNSSIRR